MESFVAPIGLAIIAFASTNVDDVFVLVTFFADRDCRVRDVVIGQYAGVGALYATSAIAALISVIVPSSYVGLLGLVPFAIGIKKLWNLYRGDEKENLQSAANRREHGALTVASVTMANGGDNIAVYTALLETRKKRGLSQLCIGCLLRPWLPRRQRRAPFLVQNMVSTWPRRQAPR